MKKLITLFFLSCFPVFAAAPTRPIAYTEAVCATSSVFFCEDFEGQDINCLGFNNCNSTWNNPGIQQEDICFCGGGSYQVNTATRSGFPAGDRVWRVSKTTGFTDVVTGFNTGTGNGTIAGFIDPAIMGTGAQDWYTRFQVWFSSDHIWPSDLDFKTFFALPRVFVDPPSAAYEAGVYFHQDFFCSGPGNFNDVPAIRYSSNFRQFPYQNEYCPPLSPGVNPNGTQAPRFQRNRWYTIEYHVRLDSTSSGILELWVDGFPTYSSQRITCHNGCSDMGYIMIMGWMNSSDPPHGGYYEIDNVVMSRSYIGVPAGGGSPPACSDGLDNDSDGQTDHPADTGCTSSQDTDESNPTPFKIGFDNPQPPGSSGSYLNGLFQGIDFGLRRWRWEGPYLSDPSNHIYFASNSGNSRTFTFSPGPKKLKTLNVFTGVSGTLTLSDNLGQRKVQSINSGAMRKVTTNWLNPSTTIAVHFNRGWELGVDDIEYGPP